MIAVVETTRGVCPACGGTGNTAHWNETLNKPFPCYCAGTETGPQDQLVSERYECGCERHVRSNRSTYLKKCAEHAPRPWHGGLPTYACCPNAKPRNCVCVESINCEAHGTQCVGSHD